MATAPEMIKMGPASVHGGLFCGHTLEPRSAGETHPTFAHGTQKQQRRVKKKKRKKKQRRSITEQKSILVKLGKIQLNNSLFQDDNAGSQAMRKSRGTNTSKLGTGSRWGTAGPGPSGQAACLCLGPAAGPRATVLVIYTAMCTRISESQEGEQREGGKARRGRTVWREETKGRRSCRPVRRAGWGPPPASGDEPPVPRGSLSAPYRTTLPRGPSSRDDGFLSLPPRWSICLSSRHKAAWPELAGNRHLVQLLVGPVHPSTEIWTRPSSLSAFLPSLIPT